MKEPVQLCYSISEAAKLMNVEPHVLRYWEDELGLNISRNSMGHRIYTDDDLKTFKSIQHLKANHISLKDIRDQLPSTGPSPVTAISPSGQANLKNSNNADNGDKMTQFRAILTNIIKDAMSENSKELSDNISSKVSNDVRKEIDFLVRQREEEDEERFKKLDETIRTFQKARQETAIAKLTETKGKRKYLFGKNK